MADKNELLKITKEFKKYKVPISNEKMEEFCLPKKFTLQPQQKLLPELLKEEAYSNHNAEQCIEYAYKLEVFVESINKKDLDDDELEDYDYINKGIKWLKFWGNNGHGYGAWY